MCIIAQYRVSCNAENQEGFFHFLPISTYILLHKYIGLWLDDVISIRIVDRVYAK